MKNVVYVTLFYFLGREKKLVKNENRGRKKKRNLQKQLRYLPPKNDIGICLAPHERRCNILSSWAAKKKKSAATAAMGFIRALLLDGTPNETVRRAQLAVAVTNAE